MNKYNVLSLEDRPQYKAINNGLSSLSNVELISMIINRGAGTIESITQSRQLLNMCNNNLAELAKMETYRMQVVEGIGDCKALAIQAAFELGKRRAVERVQRTSLNSAEAIYKYMSPLVEDKQVEEFWVLLLNQSYKLMKAVKLSFGGLSETAVDVRLALKYALLNNATVMAISHNHPSGNNSPSNQDNVLTSKFSKACEMLRIYLLDHVIIGNGDYYSYRESGKL